MAGLTQAEAQATLDARFPTSGATDHLAFSTNGTTESASVMTRMPIGATGWAAATAAQPSIKANSAALTSPTAVGAGTITHVAVYTAISGGTQRTDWQALGSSRTVAIGDQLTLAIGALAITLD